MSKRKKKKNNAAAGASPEISAESVAASVAETVSESAEPAPDEVQNTNENLSAEEPSAETAEAEAENSGEKKEQGGLFDRKISDTENKKLHERFKFDWELEEHLVEALDEDAAELEEEEEDSEPEPLDVKPVNPAKAAQTVFGLFVLIFTIIGVVATGFKIRDIVEAQKDNSEQVEYFEHFLMPLVASDTPIFDGASSLNEDVVITAACWDIIFNPSVYYEYSGGNYQVSYLDIDRRITKLFGPGLTYTHKTVGDVDLSFEYDEETGMYSIPAYPRSPAYYSEVSEINELDGGNLEITVCYKLPITNWIPSLDTVEKTMIYTVTPSETDYNVVAIRLGEIVVSEAN